MAQLTHSLGNANKGTPDQLLESLGRLSKKSGVLATIVLDRTSGAILTTTGSILTSRTSVITTDPLVVNATSNTSDDIGSVAEDIGGIEQMAVMAWNFVKSATGLVNGFDSEDELKLLRLRTKKYELVIVPDTRYLLVAVHETPST